MTVIGENVVPLEQVLRDIRAAEETGYTVSELTRGYFERIVTPHIDHPCVLAFATKHELVQTGAVS